MIQNVRDPVSYNKSIDDKMENLILILFILYM